MVQLVAEVDSKLGGHEPSFANVDDLPFLHAVVNETLRYPVLPVIDTHDTHDNGTTRHDSLELVATRLYPPVPVDSKSAVNDDVLPNGAVIRAGVRCYSPTIATEFSFRCPALTTTRHDTTRHTRWPPDVAQLPDLGDQPPAAVLGQAQRVLARALARRPRPRGQRPAPGAQEQLAPLHPLQLWPAHLPGHEDGTFTHSFIY